MLFFAGGDDGVVDGVGLFPGEGLFGGAQSDGEQQSLAQGPVTLGIAVGLPILYLFQAGPARLAYGVGQVGPAHRFIDHKVEVVCDCRKRTERLILRHQVGSRLQHRQFQFGDRGWFAQACRCQAVRGHGPQETQSLAVQLQLAAIVGIQELDLSGGHFQRSRNMQGVDDGLQDTLDLVEDRPLVMANSGCSSGS